MPAPGQGEAREDADRVERDERVHAGVEDEDQRQGDDAEHDDAVGEGEPVASFGQLARQVLVRGDVVGEEGEPVEGRVAPGVEDHDRRHQRDVIDDVPQAVGAEDVEHLLAHDRGVAGVVGDRVRPAASSVMPSNKKARMLDIVTRVLRALDDSGRRKLATPLEIASSPVNDEPPLA